MGDQTIVDEELIASQVGSEIELDDDDLINLLADLAKEAKDGDNDDSKGSDKDIFSESDNSQSPCAKISHRTSQEPGKKLSQAISEVLDEEDENETLEMSQAVWDTDENWD